MNLHDLRSASVMHAAALTLLFTLAVSTAALAAGPGQLSEGMRGGPGAQVNTTSQTAPGVPAGAPSQTGPGVQQGPGGLAGPGAQQGPGVSGSAGSTAVGPSIYNPSGGMLPESTPVTGQETPLFGGGSLTMMYGRTGAQMLSVLLQSKEGGLVVVDGGWEGDADALLEAVRARGGHVNAWLITHPDSDHAGALCNILGRGETGIVIDHIYCCLAGVDWYNAVDPGEAPFITLFKQRLALPPLGMVVDIVSAGYQISAPGIETKVLNNALFGTEEPAVNNSSVVYRVEMNGVRILFLGDLGEAGGNLLLQSVPREELKADIVQMSHHGQAGVGKNVYEAVAPSICLWPTPLWLWNNDSGSGYGSGSWRTLETRGWMRDLGVTRNYVMKDGDIVLR